MSRLQDVLIRGLRIDQPLPTDVSPGTVYVVIDEAFLQEQSDGAFWEQFGPTPGGGGGGGGLDQLTGDVAAGPGTGSQVATIQPGVVTNAKLANVPTATIKGRTTTATGSPEDLTPTQATALLTPFVGDTGTGGAKGLVPAPAAGDAVAGKFLKADGTFQTPASGSSGITQLTGDVTAGPGSGSQAAAIAANAVTNTQLRDSAALSVLGRSANSTGDPADIAGATVGHVLRVGAGPVLGFGLPGYNLIEERICTGSTATENFTIPAGYRHIRVVFMGRMTTVGTSNRGVWVQFNGDTGANYDRETTFAFGNVPGSSEGIGLTQPGIFDGPEASCPAGLCGGGEMLIPHYAGTTFHKTACSLRTTKNTNASGGTGMVSGTVHWRNTAAITSILFGVATTGNFAAGTTFTIYGIL